MKSRQVFFIAFAILYFLSCTQESPIVTRTSSGGISDSASLFMPELISTAAYERDLAIHPHDDLILFTRGTADQSRRALVAHTSSVKQEILPFSGRYNDIEPFFNPQGDRLFFASDRPLPQDGPDSKKDYNIWQCDYLNGQWGEPQALDSVINTEGQEYYPSVTRSGDLYFTGQYPDGIGKEDIYVCRKSSTGYSSRIALDTAVNTTTYEFNAYVDPDERFLLFSSYGRVDGKGGGDLYISIQQADGQWGVSKNVHSINTTRLDYCPFVFKDQLYFTSERKTDLDVTVTSPDVFIQNHLSVLNGGGNIFVTDLSSFLSE